MGKFYFSDQSTNEEVEDYGLAVFIYCVALLPLFMAILIDIAGYLWK